MPTMASSTRRDSANIPSIHPRLSDFSSGLSADFYRQQIAKQDRSNYHSTSLRTMIAPSVNRTALHPAGVQYVSFTFSFSFLYLPQFSCLLSISLLPLGILVAAVIGGCSLVPLFPIR